MTFFYEWCKRMAEAGLLPASFRYEFMVRGILAALLVSPLLGGLSHLVVTKRLAFFSAALGNAALTGLSIGIVAGEPLTHPYGGLFGFCLLVAISMVYIQRRSRLSPDTLVGVFLALTLGLGICLLVAVTRRFNIHQIQAVMFGDILTVTDGDLLLLLAIVLGVGAVLARYYNEILFGALDASLARSTGVNVAALEYLFVVLLTFAIVASLKIIGAFLVAALVVVPAAGARNLASTIRGYFGWSMALATAGSLGGLMLSDRFPVPSGGAIVLTLSILFFLTLAIGAIRRRIS
jgi:zinc transport system permease protein